MSIMLTQHQYFFRYSSTLVYYEIPNGYVLLELVLLGNCIFCFYKDTYKKHREKKCLLKLQSMAWQSTPTFDCVLRGEWNIFICFATLMLFSTVESENHISWESTLWKRTLCKLPHEFQYIVSIGNNLSRCSNFIPKYYSRTRTIRNIFIELASDSNRIVNVIWNRHVLFVYSSLRSYNELCVLCWW